MCDANDNNKSHIFAIEELARVTRAIQQLKQLLELAQEGLSTEQLQKAGMEMAVRVTNSEGGYLHFFDENEKVIDLATWSEDVMKVCEAEATMHYPLELAGRWADCVRTRKPAVHNDYQSIPELEKGGLPEGHFTLHRHMSIPVFDHGKLVAIGGVGNKKEPYDATDIALMEVMMSCLWSVLQQGKARDILKRYSYEDGVTGIANRRKFNEVIKSEWSRLRRKGEQLSLIMVDIDFFKDYNDHYGHAEGDICLQKVAVTLQENFRRTGELVTRYGGEEFAIIVPYASLEEVMSSAKTAHNAIMNSAIPHPDSSIAEHVTVSMGIASLVPQDGSFQQLINEADANLYEAKSSGRNCIVAK
ncbi:MAG: diguanylate cyclase [Sedimenticola sp.]